MEWTARKIAELRIFDDHEGKLNLSLKDIGGPPAIAGSRSSLSTATANKGRRPSYSDAAPPAEAEKMYQQFVEVARRWVPDVQSGKFQAMMDASLTNSGPVTLILDSRKTFQ